MRRRVTGVPEEWPPSRSPKGLGDTEFGLQDGFGLTIRCFEVNMKTVEIKKYAEAWRRREASEMRQAEALRRTALLEAGRAASMLAREYHIKKAVLFGSVLEPGRFRRGSDIDMAVEGLKPALFFKACGQLMTDFDFEIDLKPLEDLKGLIRERVEKGRVVYEKD